MDNSATQDNSCHEPRDMEKRQFADLEKVGGLAAEYESTEEEETLRPAEAALEMLIVVLNWSLFSALITGSIWALQLISPRPDASMHDPSPRHALSPLSHGVLFVGSILSFSVAFLIVLGKSLMGQYTLTLRLPPFGLRSLPKSRVQDLRAIPTSMPTWFMGILKSLRFILPLIQFLVTAALLAIYWLKA
ncbi:hypothetical protein DEU56DRAFT_121072 [Suillus clintonianus]|uniref:uncharacterized protein n=1 Tax=Suillus clintonianus TaxID=1904413 RepID=UPI001B87B618|nr:uncharacterized protein DEU56DRAFT_121072 [Suillus clintonianus]KAG2119392.1 hypothetical protein DEU56DRAFT_121072 [Suillus clintonianus]